jgi:hypothetical protein
MIEAGGDMPTARPPKNEQDKHEPIGKPTNHDRPAPPKGTQDAGCDKAAPQEPRQRIERFRER